MSAHIPVAQRFWYKVTPNDATGCWEWTGARMPNSYGKFNINQVAELAHRVSYKLFVGDIPDDGSYHGMTVMHKCDNPACVRPDHLVLGTHKENMHDMIRKGRSRHPSMRPNPQYCQAMKHKWIPENIKVTVRKDRNNVVERSCKACGAEKAAERYRKAKDGRVIGTHSYTPEAT